MEMPKVSRCEVLECAYNMDEECHAMAITIGDVVHPKCDTLCMAVNEDLDVNCFAGVGACKTIACSYNQGFECMASEISVGYNSDEVDCMTFRQR